MSSIRREPGGSSEVRKAIREWMSGSGTDAAARLTHLPIATADDALAVIDVLPALKNGRRTTSDPKSPSALHVIANLFQQVRTREAFDVLLSAGLPSLRVEFDAAIGAEVSDADRDDLLLVAQVFALYRCEEDLPRIATAARHPGLRDGLVWPAVFGAFDEHHPRRRDVLEALRAPLPEGFAGVAFLDYANRLAREGGTPHPFGTADGSERLDRHLTDADPSHWSFAHSAAAALPFIADPPRGRLLALGLDHPSERVQIEAAWASAKLGSRAAVDLLARRCLDPKTSSVAVEYLEELGELNAIPARAKEPNFQAVAEMSRWLSHPMEFGRPPDDAEVYDCRVLFWPPANERRRLWLVRYRYDGSGPHGGAEQGLGLVGSITFALFGEVTADLSAEDAYALHCCWELEVENDPRAPQERTTAAGREILRRHGNEGF